MIVCKVYDRVVSEVGKKRHTATFKGSKAALVFDNAKDFEWLESLPDRFPLGKQVNWLNIPEGLRIFLEMEAAIKFNTKLEHPEMTAQQEAQAKVDEEKFAKEKHLQNIRNGAYGREERLKSLGLNGFPVKAVIGTIAVRAFLQANAKDGIIDVIKLVNFLREKCSSSAIEK